MNLQLLSAGIALNHLGFQVALLGGPALSGLIMGTLAIAGAADTVSVLARGALVQLVTPDSHRGRVSAAQQFVTRKGGYTEEYAGGMSHIERIEVDPAIVHGRPHLRGTRVRVSDVLALLAAGVSSNEILEDYPYLTVEDISACLEYAAMQSDRAILLAS